MLMELKTSSKQFKYFKCMKQYFENYILYLPNQLNVAY